MSKTFRVEKDYHDSRFDKWFKRNVLEVPQSLIEKIIRQNKVRINSKKTKSSYRVQEGDIINIYELNKIKTSIKKEKIKYKPNKKELNKYDDIIIDNNENFIVINKPAGVPVQSGTKSFKNIFDILKNTKYFQDSKPYIVHRIDKETSGILIIAKNRKFAQLFTSLFRIRKIHKTYIAITYGKISKNFKILRDNLIYYENNKQIEQKALSYLRILKSNDAFSYVELKPVTGRKHQLRKQLLKIAHPIVGDDKYFIKNYKKLNTKSLLLHAYKIKFMINDIKYSFQAKYHENFENFLKKNF